MSKEMRELAKHGPPQEFKLHDSEKLIPNEPLVLSKESFRSQFFLIGTDNNNKIEFKPQEVGPNLINQIIKMVADLEAGKRVVIRALKVDTKAEIEQRNKVLPEGND